MGVDNFTSFSRVSIGNPAGPAQDKFQETGPFLSIGTDQDYVFAANTGGTTVFNESGKDVDFRVEGAQGGDILSLDAGNDTASIGTSNAAAFKRIASSVVSVDPGPIDGSGVTTVGVSLNGAEQDDTAIANPESAWSGDNRWVQTTAVCDADDSVQLFMSNTSTADITPGAMNWRVTAIAF